ncbi:hypothetical protein NL868_001297 [Shigella flexneri]|nr:hypothetical protein [Shigella flexneri]
MTIEEIDQLFLLKHQKGIKNKEIAAGVNCSETHISRLFKHEGSLSIQREQAVANFIREY